jgi:CDP-diacylglycerol---serine O-phosphatidyltransferase
VAQMLLKKRRLGGAVYVLPNLITTGNLFFGFFSVVKCLQGDYKWAASAILLAAVFDVLDGRVARLTGGTSEFGVQYDSLCDLLSFGLAPAFLMYEFGLSTAGRIGWIFCFLFLACGALRLARFNVQSSIGKASGDFTGLPIPMAAGVVACYVATAAEFGLKSEEVPELLRLLETFFTAPEWRRGFLLVAAPGLALLMVSNLAFRSHKLLHVTFVKPFRLLVLAVLIAGLIAYAPEFLGFSLFVLYALSGPLEWVLGWKKAVDDDEIFTPVAGNDSVIDPMHDEDEASIQSEESRP